MPPRASSPQRKRRKIPYAGKEAEGQGGSCATIVREGTAMVNDSKGDAVLMWFRYGIWLRFGCVLVLVAALKAATTPTALSAHRCAVHDDSYDAEFLKRIHRGNQTF